VPPESRTLGLGHLQFEALITTARLSDNPNDFPLIAMLGLLGLRISSSTCRRSTHFNAAVHVALDLPLSDQEIRPHLGHADLLWERVDGVTGE
jgi:hypothetical protein